MSVYCRLSLWLPLPRRFLNPEKTTGQRRENPRKRRTAMNRKPVYYRQGDPRWARKPYQAAGESSTIGSAGCGPTCAAMMAATLADRSVTPETTCAWSVRHGYKALRQGTYYAYFHPQLASYGIDCRQLLGNRIINLPDHPVHKQVQRSLGQGYYAIALMGPGTWTKGGHFVLLWDWDNKVRILDPASSAERRLNGDPATFRREVRNYWLVDARKYNRGDDGVDISKLTDKDIIQLVNRIQDVMSRQPITPALISKLEEAKAMGITDGTVPNILATRAQAAVMALRAVKHR